MTEHIFRLQVLPAGNGDALILEYGTTTSVRRVLIDGGVAGTGAEIAGLLGDSAIELVVVTHIDNDHIAGLIDWLNRSPNVHPNDFWFNGFRHLPAPAVEPMGPIQGEILTRLILDRKYCWNHEFEQHAVSVPDDRDRLLKGVLPGDLRYTILSPGCRQLSVLRDEWVKVVQSAGLDPEVAPTTAEPDPPPAGVERMGALRPDVLADVKTAKDRAAANGSSIAVLFEFQGHSCLLTGDAHPDVLIDGIDRLVGKDRTMQVDLFKVPHHGSKANVTVELVKRVQADMYVFSTDGSGNQRHPDDEAVARVIRYGGDAPQLIFNYKTSRNRDWDRDSLRRRYGYTTRYPDDGTDGITIDLLADR
jgi:hypothetical protein